MNAKTAREQTNKAQETKNSKKDTMNLIEKIKFGIMNLRANIAAKQGYDGINFRFNAMRTMPEEVDKYINGFQSKGYSVDIKKNFGPYHTLELIETEFGTVDMLVSW